MLSSSDGSAKIKRTHRCPHPRLSQRRSPQSHPHPSHAWPLRGEEPTARVRNSRMRPYSGEIDVTFFSSSCLVQAPRDACSSRPLLRKCSRKKCRDEDVDGGSDDDRRELRGWEGAEIAGHCARFRSPGELEAPAPTSCPLTMTATAAPTQLSRWRPPISDILPASCEEILTAWIGIKCLVLVELVRSSVRIFSLHSSIGTGDTKVAAAAADRSFMTKAGPPGKA